MGDIRYGTKSGHTVEPPSPSVNDSNWTLNGSYNVANMVMETWELPSSWTVTNHSAIKKDFTTLKTNESVDVMRSMVEGKSEKGKGQGVYDINLKFIGKKIADIKITKKNRFFIIFDLKS